MSEKTPYGWTPHPQSRGWIVPARTPQSEEVKKLKAENKEMKAQIQELMERFDAMENDKS